MPDHFRLVTLGTPALWRNAPDGPEPVFGPSKPLALITYLFLAVGRQASRDQLVDLLWSGTAPDQARRTLRQTVWLIRHRLGDEALTSERDEPALGIDLTSDRDELPAALSAGELERAVRLYTGPFFASFAAPGAVEFEHWADLERHRPHGGPLDHRRRRALLPSRRPAIARRLGSAGETSTTSTILHHPPPSSTDRPPPGGVSMGDAGF